MDNLVEAVRLALRDDADSVARCAGLVACREILSTLEASTAAPKAEPAPGAPPPSSPAPESVAAQPPVPPIDTAAIATLVASLGKLPPEQLLDLAISRLRAALPQGTSVPAPSPLRFQLVPLHHLERPK